MHTILNILLIWFVISLPAGLIMGALMSVGSKSTPKFPESQ